MIEKNTEASIVLTIMDLSNLMYRKGNALTQPFGLTTQQWLILLFLAEDPNIPDVHPNQPKPRSGMLASEIATALNVSRPNITNMVNVLIQKGLVAQVENSSDRRQKYLKLTPKAFQVLEQIEPIRTTSNLRLFSKLQEDEKEKLLGYLQACLKILYDAKEK